MALSNSGTNYNTSANQTKNSTYNYSPTQAPQSIADGNKDFNYSEIYDAKNPESSSTSTKNTIHGSTSQSVWNITMGQTQNFTLTISPLNDSDKSFTLNNRAGLFLPIKSLDFKPVTLEHLKIKAGIFSDLPFFHRRKLGTLQCVMWDSDKSLITQNLYRWFNSCIHVFEGCVPYVGDMCMATVYAEYTHDGKVAVQYMFGTIPDGDIQVGRTVENDSGALTEYKFNLIIVTNIRMWSGAVKNWVEADWGDGFGQKADYERRLYGNASDNGKIMHVLDPAIADQL